MADVRCPYCNLGFNKPGGDRRCIAHVHFYHLQKYSFENRDDVPFRRCWCGYAYRHTDTLAQHIEAHGGVEAHWLAHCLGVPDA